MRDDFIFLGAGLVIGACCVGVVLVRPLQQNIVPFLALYSVAYLAYGTAIWSIAGQRNGRHTLVVIVGLAALFRVVVLFSAPPSLSDDVYRYMWDGRLANAGANPYAHAVNAPALDRLDSPERALVNHPWMASPYLPSAQVLFALVSRLAPNSAVAFQVAAAALDFVTGWLVLSLLRHLRLPPARALIYLWNPLVVVEFAHGAHIDALMLCLTMAALWALVAHRSRLGSAVALAAATLTKGLPVLLAPILFRRWGWRHSLVYLALLVAACLAFVPGAGWGLRGPPDGTGLVGALRIYLAQWDFNGGLYHWLESLLAGLFPTGVAETPALNAARAAKLVVGLTISAVLVTLVLKASRSGNDLGLLRLMLLPLGGYLLLATTVHPWYVTIVIPLLPFLPPRQGEATRSGRFLVPWVVFAGLVALSYLAYLDPASPQEYGIVRVAEYVPLYLLLIWAAWPTRRAAAQAGDYVLGQRTGA